MEGRRGEKNLDALSCVAPPSIRNVNCLLLKLLSFFQKLRKSKCFLKNYVWTRGLALSPKLPHSLCPIAQLQRPLSQPVINNLSSKVFREETPSKREARRAIFIPSH